MRPIHVVFVLLAIGMAGCGRRERTELNELEQEAAATIQKFLVLHDNQGPEAVVTNVNQLFALMDLSRKGVSPHFLHSKLTRQASSAN
jgi:hypothetical protein